MIFDKRKDLQMAIYKFASLMDYSVTFYNGSVCFFITSRLYAPISDEFATVCKELYKNKNLTIQYAEKLNKKLSWFNSK